MKNDSPFRDESEANPESVLEKLKRWDRLRKVVAMTSDTMLKQHQSEKDIDDIAPRLIAALELVEQKAQQGQRKNSGYWEGYHDGMIAWAREIRAVVNGETKGE